MLVGTGLDAAWTKTGTMKYARYFHGVSTVPEETKKYCKPWFQESNDL